MKKKKRRMSLLLATIAIAFLAFPAKSADAKELAVSTSDNPYFSVAYQQGNKPVKFKKHSKSLFQGDSCIINLRNVKNNMHVTFRSSDNSVFTVKKLSDTSCRVTGVGYGSAKVIARINTDSGFFLFDETETIRTKLNVSPKAASVRFRVSQKKITVQTSAKLVMTIRPSISKEKPVFQTMNSKIATISPKGVVTGKKVGKTYVTATIQNGKTAKCKIIVKKAKKQIGKTKKITGKTKK